jgi:hypothetical protein
MRRPRTRATAGDPPGLVSNGGSVLTMRITADKSEERMKVSGKDDLVRDHGGRYVIGLLTRASQLPSE